MSDSTPIPRDELEVAVACLSESDLRALMGDAVRANLLELRRDPRGLVGVGTYSERADRRKAAEAVADERRRQQAREQVRRERADAAFRAPSALEVLSNAPDHETDDVHRVEGFLPLDGSATVIGAAKVGKSTLLVELVRCLVDGEPFLDAYPVKQVDDGRVVVLNLEVSPRTYRRWLRRAGIRNAHAVGVLHMRGTGFEIESPAARAWLVDQLRQASARVLIVDPFSAIYRGQSDVDNREVRGWLDELSAVALEAGVREVVLGVHAGRDKSRSRGASALDDWPDAVWTITRDASTNLRSIAVDGRHDRKAGDVVLTFDESTHRVALDVRASGITPAQRKAHEADRRRAERYSADRADEMQLLHLVRERPGMSARELRSELRSRLSSGAERAGQAIDRCVVEGDVAKVKVGRSTVLELTDKGRARIELPSLIAGAAQ